MKIVIFLAAVSAANISVGGEGFIPTVTVEKCGNGFQVKFPNNSGIEKFDFHANINKPIKAGGSAEFDILIEKYQHGGMIYRKTRPRLYPGYTVHYWTLVRFNGHDYQSEVKTYTEPKSDDAIPTPVVRMCGKRGFEVSFKGVGTQMFEFHANVNKPIPDGSLGQLSGTQGAPTDGRWMISYPWANLNVGNRIYFWTKVRVNGSDHEAFGRRFTVPAAGQYVVYECASTTFLRIPN